ncbi:MAG: ABC transporter permease [Pseudomonadota bacterium]
MSKVLVIAKREFLSFFNSPVAYIVISLFLLTVGTMFFVLGAFFLRAEATMRSFFGYAHVCFLFIAPALTMRMLAEEKRTGTFEILATLPVKEVEIVIGKFFAALSILVVALIFTFPYAISISYLGDLDWGPVVGGYIGLILLGGAYLAIGILASSWTDHQIISFIVALMISFAFYIMDWVINFIPSWAVSVINAISLQRHFTNIARGVVDTRDLIFFLSIIVFALLWATRSIEARKWK